MNTVYPTSIRLKASVSKALRDIYRTHQLGSKFVRNHSACHQSVCLSNFAPCFQSLLCDKYYELNCVLLYTTTCMGHKSNITVQDDYYTLNQKS